MISIVAYQIADDLPIKRIRQEYKGTLLLGELSAELLYSYKDGHIFILNYGVVVFANVDDIDRTNFIKMLRAFNPAGTPEIGGYQEDFTIKINELATQPVFNYNEMVAPYLDENILRITMLQVAQSTALDYYQATAQQLMENSRELVGQLEQFGTFRISKKNLLQFIGKTLNTKNRIFDNLYVLDSPPIVWENEMLGRINDGLNRTFDIGLRFKEIDYLLKMISENLSLFIDLTNEKESHRLEWIIIILILIEVAHLALTGLFKLF